MTAPRFARWLTRLAAPAGRIRTALQIRDWYRAGDIAHGMRRESVVTRRGSDDDGPKIAPRRPTLRP